jgi:hypothetical protein
MSQHGSSERATVTILLSHAFGSAGDGKVAILLKTKELGTIAFEVDQRTIDALRRDLACAETLIRYWS